MRGLAEALARCEATRARTTKVEALSGALRDIAEREPEHLPFATRFVTGSLLPEGDDRILGTGGTLVFEAACLATGITAEALADKARRSGDIGTAIGEAIEEGDTPGGGLSFEHAQALATTLAETGSRNEKLRALVDAFSAASPLEGRYLARAILREMRVGAKEGVVEDAVAKAFGRALPAVRRAAGLLGDLGEVARLACEDRLEEARLEPGRACGFMLATPIETARGKDLTVPHAVEDKIDGIRAQVHVTERGVRIFARGKGAVTAAFPDVAKPLEAAGLPPAVLDGEIVVMTDDGRPRPFSALQPRLKKTEPEPELLASLPVRYLVYDMLFDRDAPVIDLPFSERRARLAAWADGAPTPPLVLHPSKTLDGEAAIDAEFDAARARSHEGLVLKRLDAPYAAGVRGFSWLKVKKAFATLDVVVVAAQRGYGKRAGVLSDVTFAVWSDGVLLPVGKAYSGLTDKEIAMLTAKFESIATAEEKHGYLPVRPEVVLEVAFDGIQRSTRHASGFALRFPRIANIRDDKAPEAADTLATVQSLYDAQLASGHREDVTAADRKAAAPKKKGRKSGRRPDVRQKSKQLKLFDD